ncbi:MAG: hypothetical protein J0M34_02360 [Alphaproteobacteria bacterium]|nr:hypothetical protein [Alphaproteobacteria bacterium]
MATNPESQPPEPTPEFDDSALSRIRPPAPERPSTIGIIPKIVAPRERVAFDLTGDGIVNEADSLATFDLKGKDAANTIVFNLDSNRDGTLSANEINADRIAQLSPEQLEVLGNLLNGAGVTTTEQTAEHVTGSLSLFNQVIVPTLSNQNER